MIITGCCEIKAGYPTENDYLGKQPDGRTIWRITVINKGSVLPGHATLWGFHGFQDFLDRTANIPPCGVLTIREFRQYDRQSQAQVCVLDEPTDSEQSDRKLAA